MTSLPANAADLATEGLSRATKDAEPSALRCRWCGQRLPPPKATGRHRVTCGDRCRRQLDVVARKVRRRETWIAMWRAEEGGDQYAPAQIEQEIQALQTEITALREREHEGTE